MSFIEELKRRNVFKVGIAYLVGSWLLVQVADILFENIGTPQWVMQTMLVLLGVGFFVAVFFAWAFEMTPEGIKREHEVDRTQSITAQTGKKLNTALAVMLALAVGYILFDKFSGPEPVSTPEAETAQSMPQQDAEPVAEPADSRPSIAVLPFENRSPDPNDAYFTGGIHDDLLTTLSRISSLKVISRTSVEQYADTDDKSMREIANELGVVHIMDGGVQRAGNQVRINVQLIDAQNDETLWAEIFDRELSTENLFAIQSEISRRIADELEAILSPEEQDRINRIPTDNLQAYEAFMRGQPLIATRNTTLMKEAIGEFETAVRLDPDFALAWVGLARAHSVESDWSLSAVEDSLSIRENAVNRALEIDPELGEAYTAMASIHGDRGELDKAEAAYERAAQLSPNFAPTYHEWSLIVSYHPLRAQRQLDLQREALELDPYHGMINANLGAAYAAQGSYARAEEQFRKTTEMHPDFTGIALISGNVYGYRMSRFDKAIEQYSRLLELDPNSGLALSGIALMAALLEDFDTAERHREILADIKVDSYELGFSDLVIASTTGNLEGAKEAWNWVRDRVPSREQWIRNMALMYMLVNGDSASAREVIDHSSSGWRDPAKWDYMVNYDPGTACIASYVLATTGDKEIGASLLEHALALFEQLPQHTEHPYEWNVETCYLLAGDTKRAMEIIEIQLAHNHLMTWGGLDWKTRHRLPMYEAIRFEPRYQEIQAEVDRRLAEQRAAVAQMNLGIDP